MDIEKEALDLFPGMEENYKDLRQYWSPEEPSLKAFFADVVGPYLIEISQNDIPGEMDRFFEFISKVAKEEGTKDSIEVGVIEVIEDVPEVKEATRAHLEDKSIRELVS